MLGTDKYLEGLANGDRRVLARAITLVESSNLQHQAQAHDLLDQLPTVPSSIRLGLSGTPGVGKSTFIECLGLHLVEQGHKVAVLAVDPSSQRTGGSILGDKTRMERLARHPMAYIRPSPSGGFLGGVARHTRDAIALVEAAGFDVVLVETVGVGQSETAVAELSDLFVLLLSPGGGDELQGIKRGIMELADLVAVNKADGDLLPAAQRAVADHASALRLMRPRFQAWQPQVMKLSALTGDGVPELWSLVEDAIGKLRDSGEFTRQRQTQAVDAFTNQLQAAVWQRFARDLEIQNQLMQLKHDIHRGERSPSSAVGDMLAWLDMKTA